MRLDKKCGKSGIADNKKCSKKTTPAPSPRITPSLIAKVALGAGAVAGTAAIGLAAQRRFGRRDPNFKAFTSPGEDWDRIEAEARQGGKTWKVFEDNKKAVAAACASAKIDHYIREDVFVPVPRCAQGRGAYGYYVVHPSGKYGIKYAHNEGSPPTESFFKSKDSLLEEGQVLLHANRSGVPTPKVLKVTEDVLVMEHLGDFVPLHKTRSGFNGYSLDRDSPIQLRRNLLSAFETMHTAGITHNDVHFNNILVNPTNKEVRIIDFGIAGFASQEPWMFTEELQRVPYLIGLRNVRNFERRWDPQMKRVEKHLSYEEGRKSAAIVNGYYKSLRFYMEHEHSKYTKA
jgi:predicted Ser/Thr protein kinase